MDLGAYLRKTIDKKILELSTDLKETKKSSCLLEKINLDKADYDVIIVSAWSSEGEKTTQTSYNGTMKDAIKKAEEKFKKRNNRDDVQADYFVGIKIGNKTYVVPERYWRKYIEKD